MPNVAEVLKQEIRRLARKEIRSATEVLQKQVTDLKEKIRHQGQTIEQLEKALQRTNTVSVHRAAHTDATPKVRLSPTSIKKHRTRLKLSQKQLADLLKVNVNTIVRWEAGTSAPRAKHRAELVRLRGLGIRQLQKESAA